MATTPNDSAVRILDVSILNDIYQIKCPVERVSDVRAAARYLEEKMKETKRGRIVGLDRIAVITALNITYDLLCLERKENETVDELFRRIKRMQTQIEEVLTYQSQMDL